MQGEGFEFEFRMLKIGGCDLILGMDWIDLVAPVVLHTRLHSITFLRGNRMVTIVGYQESRSLGLEDSETIRGLLRRSGCNWVAQIRQIESAGSDKQEIIPNHVEFLLNVFQEPNSATNSFL